MKGGSQWWVILGAVAVEGCCGEFGAGSQPLGWSQECPAGPTHLFARPARSRPPQRARSPLCLPHSGGLHLASGGSAPGAAWALAVCRGGSGALPMRDHPLGWVPGVLRSLGSPSLQACQVRDTGRTCCRPASDGAAWGTCPHPVPSFSCPSLPLVLCLCRVCACLATLQPHIWAPGRTCPEQQPSPFLLGFQPASALRFQPPQRAQG